ncbi:MAG: ABC transporter permease subunit [Blastocatellia bacterium]
MSGTPAAVAAVIHGARLSSADPNAGAGFELNAIAACVIGGATFGQVTTAFGERLVRFGAQVTF